MSRRTYHAQDNDCVHNALRRLQEALTLVKRAGAMKTAARIRAAISSCKGAQRHIDNLQSRSERVQS